MKSDFGKSVLDFLGSKQVLAIEEKIGHLPRPALVAVCGPSCAGKTTVANYLAKKMSGNVLAMDAFYLPIPEIPCHLPGIPAFDSPAAFDMALLLQCLLQIRKGITVEVPVYNYFRTAEGRDPSRCTMFVPTSLTFLDGILSFGEGLMSLLDFSIYVDRDPDILRETRIIRDVSERGVCRERSIEIYDKMCVPLFEKYGRPQRESSHVVLMNT